MQTLLLLLASSAHLAFGLCTQLGCDDQSSNNLGFLPSTTLASVLFMTSPIEDCSIGLQCVATETLAICGIDTNQNASSYGGLVGFNSTGGQLFKYYPQRPALLLPFSISSYPVLDSLSNDVFSTNGAYFVGISLPHGLQLGDAVYLNL
jgi:hypothetical protein